MERLNVTPETQAAMDSYKASYGQSWDPDGNIYTGSNLIADDHLEIDSSWKGIIMGGEGGLVWFCIPDWGDMMLPIDLIDYITDRAGPDGQTLPVFDPPAQVEARGAASTPVTAAEPKQKRGRHSSLKDALRDAIKALPHDRQKHAREVLKKHGVLND